MRDEVTADSRTLTKCDMETAALEEQASGRVLRPGFTDESQQLPALRVDVAAVAVLLNGTRYDFTMLSNGGETILEAAERCRLDRPFSCRSAVCATCRTKVVKGAVNMAQNYALEPSEVEAGYILACQARPQIASLNSIMTVHSMCHFKETNHAQTRS